MADAPDITSVVTDWPPVATVTGGAVDYGVSVAGVYHRLPSVPSSAVGADQAWKRTDPAGEFYLVRGVTPGGWMSPSGVLRWFILGKAGGPVDLGDWHNGPLGSAADANGLPGAWSVSPLPGSTVPTAVAVQLRRNLRKIQFTWESTLVAGNEYLQLTGGNTAAPPWGGVLNGAAFNGKYTPNHDRTQWTNQTVPDRYLLFIPVPPDFSGSVGWNNAYPGWWASPNTSKVVATPSPTGTNPVFLHNAAGDGALPLTPPLSGWTSTYTLTGFPAVEHVVEGGSAGIFRWCLGDGAWQYPAAHVTSLVLDGLPVGRHRFQVQEDTTGSGGWSGSAIHGFTVISAGFTHRVLLGGDGREYVLPRGGP